MDVVLVYDDEMEYAASLGAIIDDLDIDDTALYLDHIIKTPDNSYRVCGWKDIDWNGSSLEAALNPILKYYRHTLIGVENGKVAIKDIKVSDDDGTDEVFGDDIAAFDEEDNLFYSEYTDKLDDF